MFWLAIIILSLGLVVAVLFFVLGLLEKIKTKIALPMVFLGIAIYITGIISTAYFK